MQKKQNTKVSEMKEKKNNALKFLNKMSHKNFGHTVPVYTIRNETSENKIDSILKFVAHLRKNMKIKIS